MTVSEMGVMTDDDRLDKINTLIVKLASGDLNARETPSDDFDEVDAIIAGINMLGEELQSSTVSRNYLKSIYDGIVDMVIIVKENGLIQGVNGAVTKLLDYSENDLIGKNLSEVFKSDSAEPLGFLEHLRDDSSLHNIEGMVVGKSGRETPVSTSCSILIDSKGEPAGLLLVAKDMTVQKQIEAELKKSKEAAELSNRMKSSFLANMSHEIRTPLNGILGFTEYLIGMSITDEQKEYLQLIESSGQTLMKLLSDILDLNKIEEGKLGFDYVPIHFKETMTSSLQPYKYMANEKGVAFDLQFENFDQISHVYCDPTRVNQIMVNLVGNALKFTSKGKVSVSLSISPISDGKRAMIRGCVSDTGIGIPEGVKNDIFKAFVQSDSSITRRFGGSGLGLSIVKELIHLMGGEISIGSPSHIGTAENPGSEFNFNFSVDIAESPAKEAVEKFEKLEFTSQYKLLVVEDNEMNRILAGRVLNKFGATVEYAVHGKEAVQMLKVNDYDAILMDVQMPVMDGLQATRIIRRLGYNLPIIGLSANVFKEDIDRSRQAGMDDHIGKPFTKLSIFRALKNALE
ncbi:MAG: response regulator [Imperialibacter sp.]|uniref:PAS domain-containing hybrid sensor histidine kinase/response regulator n=1 Tax=Imperialibacter sp. TaxID=2038411 RepID=UPI0032EAA0D0